MARKRGGSVPTSARINGMLHLITLGEYERQRREHPATITADSLANVGYVHLSPDDTTALAVANFLYRDVSDQLMGLDLDPDLLRAEVRFEAADPAPPPGVDSDVRFPHLYGPINTDAITGVRYVRSDLAGRHVSLDERGETAELLDLLPHPEGGWYRETWTAPAAIRPDGYSGVRASATGIFFLLHAGEENVWHRVRSDELWLWHDGGPLELSIGGAGERPPERPDAVVLGIDLSTGQRPQVLVPGGHWQRARPVGAHDVLVSCVVSPGFDFADFQGEVPD